MAAISLMAIKRIRAECEKEGNYNQYTSPPPLSYQSPLSPSNKLLVHGPRKGTTERFASYAHAEPAEHTLHAFLP